MVFKFSLKAIIIILLSTYSFSDVALSGHSNNWAVLACTSSYWFNYRHVSNTLSMYYIIRKMGIPDSQIILMNAMDPSCDARNPYPGDIYNTQQMDTVLNKLRREGDSKSHHHFNSDNFGVEIDYRGDEVSVDSFMRLLTGRHKAGTPSSKMLQSGNDSNILIFLSGHGGDEFLKFRDAEEILAEDLAFAFKEMHLKKRYNEILMIIDTCQASTLANKISSPKVISIGSSSKGENSYAYEAVSGLDISVIDRFSYLVNIFFHENTGIRAGNIKNKPLDNKGGHGAKLDRSQISAPTLQSLYDYMDSRFLHSTASISLTDGSRDPKNILLNNFFGQYNVPMKSWSEKADSLSGEEEKNVLAGDSGEEWALNDEYSDLEYESPFVQTPMTRDQERDGTPAPKLIIVNSFDKIHRKENDERNNDKNFSFEAVKIVLLFLTFCVLGFIFDLL